MIDPKLVISDPARGVVKQVRPLQVDLTTYLNRKFSTDTPCVVEAGTGIGKSFSYLVNALQAAEAGKRTLVSTAMKSLQQQLLFKDLPYLSKALNPTLKYARLLGKNNYGCKRQVDRNVFNKVEKAQYEKFFDQVEHWVWDDAPEGMVLPANKRAHSVAYCGRSRCPFADECLKKGYLAAKEAANNAHIVVVNHSLVGAEIRTWQNYGKSILGDKPFDHIVVDEAHTFPAKVRDSLAYEMPAKFFDSAANKFEQLYNNAESDIDVMMDMAMLEKIPRRLPLLSSLSMSYDAMHKESARTRALGNTAFTFARTARTALGELQSACGAGARQFSYFLSGADPMDWQAFVPLDARIRKVESIMQLLYYLDEYAGKLFNYANAIDLATAHRLKYVTAVTSEEDLRNGKESSIKIVPVEVGDNIAAYMDQRNTTPAYLSATLTVDHSFNFFAEEVGLGSAITNDEGRSYWSVPQENTFYAGTPFDYAKQAWGYYPDTLPEVPDRNAFPAAREAYYNALARECKVLLDANQGHAFILFTSKMDLQEVHQRLRALGYKYPLLVQSDEMKARAREVFLRTPHATLLGLKTFWEGIDVPGLHLSLVIIPKLPFPNPSDPIIQAKSAAAEKAWFSKVSMPYMLTDLRQMVGRLIRSVDDQGVVAILDRRIHTKWNSYGHKIVDAVGYPKWGKNQAKAVHLLGQVVERRNGSSGKGHAL